MKNIFYLSIIILLFCGYNVLYEFGWDLSSNFSFYKIYPSFYLILFVSLCLCLQNSSRFLSKVNEEIGLLIIIGILCIFKIRGGEGAISQISTCILLPVLISLLIKYNKTKPFLKTLKRIILSFYITECLIAIVERLLLINIFPHWYIGIDYDNQIFRYYVELFRSTALQGHPLQNALCVTIVMAFILFDHTISITRRYVLWTIGYAAILCFNTRSSMFLWLILFFLYICIRLFSNDNPVKHKEKLTLLLFTLIASLVLGYLVIVYKWGYRLVDMGLLDKDSSQVRLDIWSLFSHYNWTDFLWGFETNLVMRTTGVDIIENFWLIYVFYYGAIFTILLTLFYSFLFKRILQGYILKERLFILTPFIVIASTNNSLAITGVPLCLFIMCSYVFNPKY